MAPLYDVFLSYNNADRPLVQGIRKSLESRTIKTFLDRENLKPGLPWPQALEDALGCSRAVIVFIGPKGLGPWQLREVWWALDRQANHQGSEEPYAVIPVLLPNADVKAGFLQLNTWIDLRQDPNDPVALESLATALGGAAQPRAPEPQCPYRGLRAFREEDAPLFFGREQAASDLLRAVVSRDLVCLVAPSGSGKSSVVQAGLLPLLHRERTVTWETAIFTPGDRPWRRMADALIPLVEPDLPEVLQLKYAADLEDVLKGGGLSSTAELILKKCGTDRLLVILDQFEEILTLAPEVERTPFLRTVLDGFKGKKVSFLIVVRADFYGRAIAESRDLSDALSAGKIVNLGPMRRQELCDCLVKPAGLVGLNFAPGLVDRILDDVGDEPGNLPLLQFALTELWAKSTGGLLTHDCYEQVGKIRGAIATRAEHVFLDAN